MPTSPHRADLLQTAIDPTGTVLHLRLADLVALIQGLGDERRHARRIQDALQQPHEIREWIDPQGMRQRTLLRFLDLSNDSPLRPYGLAVLRFGWRASRWELDHLDLLSGTETSVNAEIADTGLRRGTCVYVAPA
ncbi:hypothetical protein [Leptothrix discophora]|uniref:Uncharacterized protein n=1 Tax=Leptothrix discophora TaxID=89 RepID=A0ABT9FZV2_LEPDI|nr:hypothetical protein [Leptothrix discophora]MDP4299749.1 hypothetical protein [Leptothrix discophora]